jgi:hypothetical protein
MLAGYKGYLVADAHAVYDHLYRGGDVIEVGGWAHTRRYFSKALESEPERARAALALIGELFRLERQIATATREEREAVRSRQSKDVVQRFFAWCEATVVTALDETPLAKGLRYALNQRDALVRFLEDGRLPIHNNQSEQALRREAVGRENWLFIGNDDAGDVNASFASLLASCQLHRIEPWAYLLPASEFSGAARSRAVSSVVATNHRAAGRRAKARRRRLPPGHPAGACGAR